jgi:hypothetical protein
MKPLVWILGLAGAALAPADPAPPAFRFPPSSVSPRVYAHVPPRPGEERSALCQELDHHYAALGRVTSQMCTVSLPRGSEFRRPAWRPVDPNANIETVKEGFFWQFLDQQVNYGVYYNPEHRALIQDLRKAWPESDGPPFFNHMPKDISTALVERVWRSFGGPVRKMIAAGALKLETAHFDLNSDGVPEPVYRMSHLVFEVPRRPQDPVEIGVRLWSCDAAPGRDENHPYVIFVRRTDAQGLWNGGPDFWARGTRQDTDQMNDVFWYRGRPYVVWILPGQSRFVVREPASIRGRQSSYYTGTICQMGGRASRD